MPFITQPPSNPVSAYRPVLFQTFGFAPTFTDEVVNAVVTITDVDTSTQIAQYRLQPIGNVGGVFFGFDIDVQQALQDYLQPNSQAKSDSAPNADGQPFFNLDTGLYVNFTVTITYEYIDATTGLLTDTGLIDITTQLTATAATRQHDEVMNLDSYVLTIGAPLERILSNSTATQNIQLEESATVSFIGRDFGANTLALRVRTFNAVGGLIDDGTVNRTTPLSDFYQFTVGCGPNEIRNITWSAGSVNIDNPIVDSYTVQITTALNVPISELKTYRLKSVCEDSELRLHFLNALGGFDAYTFSNTKVQSINVTGTTAQKPLAWSNTAPQNTLSDKGTFSLEKTASTKFELESLELEPSTALWLKELLYSVEVYIETDQGLQPVVIEDVVQIVETKTGDRQLVKYNLVAVLANDKIIQYT